jgi:Protein of unknown function (DUF3800)
VSAATVVRSVLWRVYIDEAGDRGIATHSAGHFVVSATIVRDDRHATARAELAALRGALGRQPSQVLHFQKFSHSQRLKAVQDIAASSIEAITSAVLCKRGFDQPDPAGDLAYITNPDPMYLWAVRLVLERVSWLIRDHGGGTAVVTFAHVRHFKAQKLHDYRNALERADTAIEWSAFAGHPFKIGSPDRVEMLQMADTAASALFRAVEPDEFGNVERRYLEVLAPKLYRRARSEVTSYGLKVFPASHCAEGTDLAWLRAL